MSDCIVCVVHTVGEITLQSHKFAYQKRNQQSLATILILLNAITNAIRTDKQKSEQV